MDLLLQILPPTWHLCFPIVGGKCYAVDVLGFFFFSGILIDPSHWPTSLDKNFIANFLIRQALNYETSTSESEGEGCRHTNSMAAKKKKSGFFLGNEAKKKSTLPPTTNKPQKETNNPGSPKINPWGFLVL